MSELANSTVHAEIEHHKTIFDGWRSLSIGLYMALLGYGISVGLPVISSAWVNNLGFTPVEVGHVAGNDLLGLGIGSIIVSLLIKQVNRRVLALIGIILAVLANYLCTIYVDYDTTYWLRLFAGVGSGMYTAIAIATLGGSSRPARAFNILLFAFAFTQAAEMQVLPNLTMDEIYSLFIALYLFSALFLHWLPPHALKDIADIDVDVTDAKGHHRHIHEAVPKYVPWICLLAVLLIYIGIGSYWTYIEIASESSGVSPDWISQVLVWGSFMSAIGALFATLISNRVGIARPLIVALLVMAFVEILVTGTITNSDLFLSVMFFNFLWLFIDVYQMGNLSIFDPTGRYVSLLPGAQGIGQFIGPNLGATLLSYELGYSSVFFMCGAFSVLAMVIYASMYLRLRKSSPVLADAS